MSKLEENNKCLVGEKMDKAFDYEEELKGQYYAIGRYERYKEEYKEEYKEGYKEGFKIGRKQSAIAIAKKLLKMNLNLNKNQISQVTGLSKKEVEELIKLNE